MPKKRARRPSARTPVRRNPARSGTLPRSAVESAQREAREQDAAKTLLVALLDATADGDTEAARGTLERLLALPPIGHDGYDAAGFAAADMICDLLDAQSAVLWSDLAGPVSLDPLVDRFVPLVEAADGAHEADLRWVLEYLGDFRLSERAAARVARQLSGMAPMAPPLGSATTSLERVERILALQGTLVDLLAAGGGGSAAG